MGEPTDKRRVNLRPGTTPAVRVLPKALAYASAVLLIVIIASLSYAGSRPSSCGLCHPQETRSWQANLHREAGASCGTCHDRGPVHNFFARLGEYGRFTVGLYRRPIAGRVDSRRCRKCHAESIRGVATRAGIIVEHEGIVKAKMDCSRCHDDAGHSLANVPASVELPAMGICLDCHVRKGIGETGACRTCHEEVTAARSGFAAQVKTKSGHVWQGLHGGQADTEHGRANLKSCTFCHKDSYCQKCHGESYPHYELWITYHGQYDAGCSSCHSRGFCDSCHGVEIPHPPGWLKGHAVSTGDKSRLCYRCHEKKACLSCHSQHSHPGVPGVTLKSPGELD